MQYEYQLDEIDLLTFQLFTVSKNKRMTRRRWRSGILTGLGSIVLAFFSKNNGLETLFYYWLIFGVLILFLYPFYVKNVWKRHYKRHVIENHSERMGLLSTLEFTDKQILTSSSFMQSQIDLNQLKLIIEIKDYLFLQLKYGDTLVIPQAKIKELDHLKKQLETLSDQLDIGYIKELDWKW